MSSWIHIDDVEVTDKVNAIHCDTRDFCCLVKEETLDLRDSRHPEITKVKYKEEYLIRQDEIKPFLQRLETITGGKGSWRFMNFKGVNTRLGWFKYIRIYRVRKDLFVVCEGSDLPVVWSMMSEENLIEKHLLNHIKEELG